jgi:hypothetical protein
VTLVTPFFPVAWRYPYTFISWTALRSCVGDLASCVVQYSYFNKKCPARSPGTHTIPPPPSQSLRQQRLGDHWAKFFFEQAKFPILVTIQPNFDSCPSPSLAASGGASTGYAEKVWDMVRVLFHRLDRIHTGCPSPAYLPSHERFQGIAVMEKHRINAHVHLLLSFENWFDQFWAGMFLLEVLDNVEKQRLDPRDDEWQRDTWDLVVSGTGWSKDPSWSRTSSLILPLAPAGTAMVQMIWTPDDLKKVCDYMTKTWYQSTDQLAARRAIQSYDPVLDWKELREFHASVEPPRIARLYRIDPATGAKILDLDNLIWKSKGRVVR